MTTMRWAALALMAPLWFANPTASAAQTGQPLPIPPMTLNSNTPLTLTQPSPEVPVSPITPGTAPGTLFNETTGTQPVHRPALLRGGLAGDRRHRHAPRHIVGPRDRNANRSVAGADERVRIGNRPWGVLT